MCSEDGMLKKTTVLIGLGRPRQRLTLAAAAVRLEYDSIQYDPDLGDQLYTRTVERVRVGERVLVLCHLCKRKDDITRVQNLFDDLV
jgi:hypothetical protein